MQIFQTAVTSFRQIASEQCEDPNMGDDIAFANGYAGSSATRPNMPVTIPNSATFMNEHNRMMQWTHAMNKIVMGEGFMPDIPLPPLPQPHHSWWGAFIDAFISALFFCVGLGPLGNLLAKILGQFIGEMLAGAIIGASADISEQLVNIMFHIQNKFHWSEVGTSALVSAESSGLMAMLKIDPTTLRASLNFGKSLAQNLALTNLNMLIGIVQGTLKNPRWQDVILSEAAAVSNTAINHLGFPENWEATFAKELLKQAAILGEKAALYGDDMDWETEVGAAIGTALGYTVGSGLKAKYDRNQKKQLENKRMAQQEATQYAQTHDGDWRGQMRDAFRASNDAGLGLPSLPDPNADIYRAEQTRPVENLPHAQSESDLSHPHSRDDAVRQAQARVVSVVQGGMCVIDQAKLAAAANANSQGVAVKSKPAPSVVERFEDKFDAWVEGDSQHHPLTKQYVESVAHDVFAQGESLETMAEHPRLLAESMFASLEQFTATDSIIAPALKHFGIADPLEQRNDAMYASVEHAAQIVEHGTARQRVELVGEVSGYVAGLVGFGVFGGSERADNLPKFIKTPYGKALQSKTTDALSARNQIQHGAWLYRGGRLGRSAGPEGQFWSLENPLLPGYAEKYGIPIENTKFDFVEVSVLRPESTFITREAPGIGSNSGGGIEIVVNAGEPKLQYFHMPWEFEDDSVEQRFIP